MKVSKLLPSAVKEIKAALDLVSSQTQGTAAWNGELEVTVPIHGACVSFKILTVGHVAQPEKQAS